MEKEKKENKGSSYRIYVKDTETGKYLWGMRFSKTGLFVSVISLIVVLCTLTYCVIAYTPVRTFIPGYPDARSKRVAIQNAIKVDSLERLIYRWEIYSENLKRAVEGKAPIKIDSIVKGSTKEAITTQSPEYLNKQDSLLREMVKEEEQFEISSRRQRDLPIEGLHFFTPLKGVISQNFDSVHPFIDITAPAGSVVKAVLDGTVISSGWSNDTDDIISIYKHNEKLLKKTGDKVKAGTAIALVGNSGDLSTGTHLHFELWHKGEAIDPLKYIKF